MRHLVRIGTWVLLVAWAAAPVCRAATLIERNSAARLGLVRAWYAQVGSPRATGAIAHVNYAHGMLLVQSARGMMTALDGETGRILWATQAGSPDRLSTEPDANEEYVVVVNGSVLYVLDRAAGHIVWQKQLGGAPGAGPGVTPTHAFVPMVSGRIEGYDLQEGAKQQPWFYKSAGRVLVPPLATDQSVSWTTEKGYFYVADPSAGGIRFRLETRDAIHARPAYWTPDLYACSTDGYVYALNAARGKSHWKFSLGDAIYKSPVAIEGKLFVVTQLSGMYCLDAAHGTLLWTAPRIVQFVALSPSRIYAMDSLGQLTALDAKTGTRLGTLPLEGVSHTLVNRHSDRIFLASENCVVQCLHEIGLPSPVSYVSPPPEKVESKRKASQPAEEPADEPQEVSPAGEPAAEKMPAKTDQTPEAPVEDDADNPFK